MFFNVHNKPFQLIETDKKDQFRYFIKYNLK